MITDAEIHLKAVMIGIDDAADTMLGSMPDITISARCGMARVKRLQGLPMTLGEQKLAQLGDELNFLQPGHSEGAVLNDVDRCIAAISELLSTADYIKANNIPASYP